MSEFWNQVDKSGECWLWTGCRDAQGYGHTWADGKPTNTPPPRVPPYGTRLDNMRDQAARGRHKNTKKAECIHGHPSDDANTYITPNGRRNCRTCRAEASRAARQRKAS